MSEIFKDYQEKKTKIIKLVNKAAEMSIISKERCDEIIDKINNDVLTIGVIDQMKAGKSTFLNAFVFGYDFLPASSDPMTAALSVITYGPKPKLVATFYNRDDWAEQEMLASKKKNLEDQEESCRIEAAEELVKMSKKLGGQLNNLLGKEQEDRPENLKEYVGKEGRYVSITKYVTIYMPLEYLKGVNIVDTPGVNDPIVSREQRTMDFLKKCDCVVMLTYAGKSMDMNDTTLLEKNVRNTGISKVILGVNKYDVCYLNEKAPEEIQTIEQNTIDAIKKSGTLSDYLEGIQPKCIAAEMALLSKLGSDKIRNNNFYKDRYADYVNKFEKIWDITVLSPSSLYELSHIRDLESAVLDMINNEKAEILFSKPINEIKQNILSAIAKNKSEITKADAEIKLAEKSGAELDEELNRLFKAQKRLQKKFDRFRTKFNDKFQDDISPIIDKDFNGKIDKLIKECEGKIDHCETKLLNKLPNTLEVIVDRFIDVNLKQTMKNHTTEVKNELRSFVDEYFSDIEDYIKDKIPDFELCDFLDDLKSKITIKADADFSFDFDIGGLSMSRKWGESFKDFFDWDKSDWKSDYKNHISKELGSLRKGINSYVEYLDRICQNVIDSIQNEGVDQVIQPVIDNITDVKDDQQKKQDSIEQLKSKIRDLAVKEEQLKQAQQTLEQMM